MFFSLVLNKHERGRQYLWGEKKEPMLEIAVCVDGHVLSCLVLVWFWFGAGHRAESLVDAR